MLPLFTVWLAAAPHLTPLPDAPDEGVDVDVQASLDDAKAKLGAQDATADELVLNLFLATDRFTKAQAARVKPDAVQMLRAAAALRSQHGEVDLATRDLDAAWQLAGKGMDLQLSAALSTWSERLQGKDKAGSLYLARRALLADPANETAKRIDHQLSHNPTPIPAFSLLGVGFVTMVTGIGFAFASNSTTNTISSGIIRPRSDWDVLISANDTQKWASIGAFIVSGVCYAAGISLLGYGRRDYVPTSPALLPALPEVKP